ncbi:GNAT family N-acetyltransferase [Marinomonas ostreistagni]|uniref:GNAT family N-acetyltransferase n=1 Tax=Marinomonas ostreistagni TaxID=359209 RepID=UPI00194EE803|nr:GNAT family N-acetyltransferase [Marinomonas ostreistagni]MBM6551023.1 GNAT family N-acetyltransferase [Marinomonas ostreistagni]
MSDHYTISPAASDDLDALLALNQQANPHPWSAALMADALASGKNSRQNWLLKDKVSGELVAWLCASKVYDQSELELVVTHPDWRRRGLAQRLIEHWLDWAQAQDCHEALLEVRASNTGAIALYEKLAFAEVGRRKNYYPLADGGKEAAVLMTRPLNDAH